MDYLAGLNTQQKEAVLAPPGANLVLAGAGSGKTRVIIHRILHLLAEGLPPHRILAITFTNKAAGEMRERLLASLDGDGRGIWVGTFHAVFARILRAEAQAAGLPRNFTILSRAECLSIVRRRMKDQGINQERYSPKSILTWIGNRKTSAAPEEPDSFPFSMDAIAQRIAPGYENALREAGALDFDDLLAYPLRLFRSHPEILEKYQARFAEILVDEYQDTNAVQDELVALLSREHGRVFAVGDDDQGIYGWRGARVENILQFERRFPGARVFRLEENYRSAGAILALASRVIDGAAARHPKRLFTQNPAGAEACYLMGADPETEAEKVINHLVKAGAGEEIPWREVAVFYRINTQSRPLEQVATRRGIPYQVVKGQRFFDRPEVQDLAAYLRLLIRSEDAAAFTRIINRPPRGLGEESLRAIGGAEESGEVTRADAAAALEAGKLRETAAKGLRELLDTCERLAARKAGPARLIEEILERTGYRAWLEGAARGSASPERRAAAARALEGAEEFIAAAAAFEERVREEQGLDPKKPEAKVLFLEELALMGEADEFSAESGALSLMTLHAAKGLEFTAVGIVGAQEGLIPHSLSADGAASLDEERRLLYVGITRAKEVLCLSWAKERRPEGSKSKWAGRPSRFLDGLEPEILRRVGGHARARPGAPRGRGRARSAANGRGAGTQPPPSQGREGSSASSGGASAMTGPFAPGTRVRHDKFGTGVVRARERRGDNTVVSVDFDTVGHKKLVAEYAPMSQVGGGGR